MPPKPKDELLMALYWDTIDKCLQWACVGLLLGTLLGVPYSFLTTDGCVCSVAIVGALTGAALAYYVTTLKIDPTDKAVFITGCDSGFGHALALHLDKIGFTVFAGCLIKDGQGAKDLRLAASKKLQIVGVDVSKDSDVIQAEKFVRTNLPKGITFWGLVNNAGIGGGMVPLEWLSMEQFSKTLDVNLMGTVRTCKAFLPLIRKYKGRVVNVSSILGRAGTKSLSSYVTSKFAVQGFSDALRYEMRSLGVKVCIIEPGDYIAGTQISGVLATKEIDNMYNKTPEEVKRDYSDYYAKHLAYRKLRRDNPSSKSQNISPVIAAMTKSLMDKIPEARYSPMENKEKFWVTMSTHMPEFITDAIFHPIK